jgi:hypothetical protein
MSTGLLAQALGTLIAREIQQEMTAGLFDSAFKQCSVSYRARTTR